VNRSINLNVNPNPNRAASANLAQRVSLQFPHTPGGVRVVPAAYIGYV